MSSFIYILFYSYSVDLISFIVNSRTKRVFSSVGLERYLDRVEVTGSNPVTPTKGLKNPCNAWVLCFWALTSLLVSGLKVLVFPM